MSFKIVHWYTGHNYILEEYEDRQEAITAFDKMVADWGEPDPSDEFLELYWIDEETFDMEDEIRIHNLTDPDTWEPD